MKKTILTMFFLLLIFPALAKATPGDYTLRLKVGPSFSLKDYETQIKFGGEFDYDLGFGWGVGLEALHRHGDGVGAADADRGEVEPAVRSADGGVRRSRGNVNSGDFRPGQGHLVAAQDDAAEFCRGGALTEHQHRHAE